MLLHTALPLVNKTVSELVTARQVREAIRLFQVSTLAASKSGMIGESMGFIDSQTLEEINNCEDQIKRRVPRGERVSLQAIGAHQTLRTTLKFGGAFWLFGLGFLQCLSVGHLIRRGSHTRLCRIAAQRMRWWRRVGLSSRSGRRSRC